MTTSAARTRANGRNALLSTGPRTRAGKSRSSKNARRHGLLSAEVVLPDESSADFDALRRGLMRSLTPLGDLEQALVERVVVCAWRLHRLGRIEAGLFIDLRYNELVGQAREDARACISDGLEELRDSLVDVVDSEGLKAAKARERDAEQASRESLAASLGRLFGRETGYRDTFCKLGRYEAGIERSMYRALHELQRLQAVREGQQIAPPVAVDVQVTGPLVEPTAAPTPRG